MRCVYRLALCGLGLAVFACEDIPRDNPLDPLNPESTVSKRHLIEAFVNTGAHPSEFNRFMLDALDSLETMYGNRISIVQYHRSIGEHTDPYHLAENDIRYQHLLDALQSDFKGAPDVFVNGIARRIQGASSRENAFFRLQQALLAETANHENFYLSVRVDRHPGDIVARVTVARLGNTPAKDLRIRAILTEDKGLLHQSRVVRAGTDSEVIERLSAGEIREMVLPAMTWEGSRTGRLIVTLMDRETICAYQTSETVFPD